MKPEQQPLPPASWYIAANTPIGVAWGFGIPLMAGIGLAWPGWLTGIVTVVWFVSNARLIDRYLPCITNLIIEWLYRITHQD